MDVSHLLTDDREQRLAQERAVRAMLRRAFELVTEDRWQALHDLYREAVDQGEWFVAGFWAGLPATVRERLRELIHANR